MDFFLYAFTELQVILWPRTNAVFTCSCRKKVLTGTTFPEKYGSRAFQTGTREGLLSSLVSLYFHSSANKVQSNVYFYTKQNLDEPCRTCFYLTDHVLYMCLRVTLYTHIVFLLHLYNVLVSECVCTLCNYTLSCSTVNQRGLAHIFVLSGVC